MPLPRASRCPKRDPSGSASWILTSSTCRHGSPRAARMRWPCGVSYAPPAFRGRPSRYSAGWPSTGPHPLRPPRTSGEPGRQPTRQRPLRLAAHPRCLHRHNLLGCSSPPAALSVSDAAVVARVEQDREAARVAGLARRFSALVRGTGISQTADPKAALRELNTWLADARRSGVRAVETFAAGLEQDGAAIRAALTTPWSSGQAEGQITRLKLIKRQMYGRASFDLLRQRVLLTA